MAQSHHLSKVDGAIVLFDVTDRDSYASVHDHCYFIRSFASEKCPIMILGNKIDMDKKRKVTREEAERLSFSKLALYREISAKKKQNIEQVLDGFIESLVENMQKENQHSIHSQNQSQLENSKTEKQGNTIQEEDDDRSNSDERLNSPNGHDEELGGDFEQDILPRLEKREVHGANATSVEGEEHQPCCSSTCNIF